MKKAAIILFVILLAGIIACTSSSRITKTYSSDSSNQVTSSDLLPEATNSTTTAVSDPELKATISRSITAERLAEGKKIYIQRCTKCHSMKDPANYTVQQWDPILRKMFMKARLTDDHDKVLIREYVIVRSK